MRYHQARLELQFAQVLYLLVQLLQLRPLQYLLKIYSFLPNVKLASLFLQYLKLTEHLILYDQERARLLYLQLLN